MDGVKEPLERLMLLVDKLKADVNAVDDNPLYMKVLYSLTTHTLVL
jgi:hypothetical protein